jgi:hypothetical protein
MKKLFLLAVAIFSGYWYSSGQHSPLYGKVPQSVSTQSQSEADTAIADAFSNHKSNLQVSGDGVIAKLLPDDNVGSRHQKFIISLRSGQTLLIAHNIDIASRISSLREGDSVQFSGEYAWNEKGGIIHWTHRDPNGSHVGGWLKHNGQIYQ